MTPNPPTITLAGLKFRVGSDGQPIIPPLCGADDEAKAAAEKEAAEKAAADAKAAEEKAANAAAGKGLTPEDRAALEAVVAKERAATKAAEKAARDAQKKLDDIEAAALTENEKLKKEAEDGKALATSATEKLRRANLLSALADEGLTGAKAKAAVRLLDGVEFTDTDEPKNLKDAMKAASAEYGEDVFKAAAGGHGSADAGKGSGGGLTIDQIKQMTPQQVNQRKGEVDAVLAAQN